jgi:hypothetical protein
MLFAGDKQGLREHICVAQEVALPNPIWYNYPARGRVAQLVRAQS